VDVLGFFLIVELVVEFGVAVAPLNVTPAIGADGLAIFVSATDDEGEGGVAAFSGRIFQERAERLTGKFVRSVKAQIICNGGVKIDKFDKGMTDGTGL
jgi:hypothetical protein